MFRGQHGQDPIQIPIRPLRLRIHAVHPTVRLFEASFLARNCRARCSLERTVPVAQPAAAAASS
jgi:hypothetical protein